MQKRAECSPYNISYMHGNRYDSHRYCQFVIVVITPATVYRYHLKYIYGTIIVTEIGPSATHRERAKERTKKLALCNKLFAVSGKFFE